MPTIRLEVSTIRLSEKHKFDEESLVIWSNETQIFFEDVFPTDEDRITLETGEQFCHPSRTWMRNKDGVKRHSIVANLSLDAADDGVAKGTLTYVGSRDGEPALYFDVHLEKEKFNGVLENIRCGILPSEILIDLGGSPKLIIGPDSIWSYGMPDELIWKNAAADNQIAKIFGVRVDSLVRKVEVEDEKPPNVLASHARVDGAANHVLGAKMDEIRDSLRRLESGARSLVSAVLFAAGAVGIGALISHLMR